MQKITLTSSNRRCDNPNALLGYEEENDANKLIFEFTDGFVDGFAQLHIKRGNDKGHVDLKKVDETYQLEVKKSLVSQAGSIVMQVVITTSNGMIIKYDKFEMIVRDAIDANEELPEEYPSWKDTISEMLAQTQEAIEKAENTSNQLLKDKENGVFDGEDGFSPTTIVKIDTDTEYVLTITYKDENGKIQTYDTPNLKGGGGGSGGGNGQDGFSPIATVTQTDTGALIEITDKKGTTTASVNNGKDGKDGKNGKDGEDGEDGEDGISPYVYLNRTDTGAEITVVDVNGMAKVEVYDGKSIDTTIHGIGSSDVVLETNKLYSGYISESTVFSLPTVKDGDILNSIQVEVTISNYENITIDLGAANFFGDIPELGNGTFILYYEYINAMWCVGALPVVSEV